MRFWFFHLIFCIAFLCSVKCQESATPLYVTLPKEVQEEPEVHVDDVLRMEEEAIPEDDSRTINYERDDEVNRIHIPIDPIVGEDDATYEKKHHPPDHRFKLISLDNIVHLNPPLQVSLWLFVSCLVKVEAQVLANIDRPWPVQILTVVRDLGQSRPVLEIYRKF